MRIFASCYSAISEIARDLQELGVRRTTSTMQDLIVAGDENYDTKELINYSFSVSNFHDADLLFDIPQDGMDAKVWVGVEFLERVDPRFINPGDAYKLRPELWNQFLVRHKGKFAYSYNERIRTQLVSIIKALRADINTRQAILSIWNPSIDCQRILVDRVPCSLFYHFITTTVGGKRKLNLIYSMRSCDFVTHFCNDLWLAYRMLDYVHLEVSKGMPDSSIVDRGDVIMNISSLHVYKKDEPQLDRFMQVLNVKK